MGHHVKLSQDMLVLEICKYMGWDYHTFKEQPQFFVELAFARMRAESTVSEQNSKQKANPKNYG